MSTAARVKRLENALSPFAAVAEVLAFLHQKEGPRAAAALEIRFAAVQKNGEPYPDGPEERVLYFQDFVTAREALRAEREN